MHKVPSFFRQRMISRRGYSGAILPLALLCPALAVSAQAADTLFAAESDVPARFFRIDPASATATTVGSTNFLPGLDFRGNGTLYGASSSLYTVSTSTGSTVRIGALPDLMSSIAFSPSDRLYGVSNDGRTLYEIDPATGRSLSVVALTGTTHSTGTAFDGEINGIDFGPDGTLYGIGFAFYRIDPSTGVATRITPLGRNTGGVVDLFTDIDVSADGQIRAATFGIPGSPSLLYRIDPSTGVGQLIGDSGVALAGIASGPEGIPPSSPNARLSNVSIRSTAGTGDQTLIVGFSLSGNGSKQVLIRGVGPTLGQFGVSGALADPQLSLFDGSSRINQNDDWGGGTALSNAFTAMGAFGLAPNSKDAAMLVQLAAKSYSAQVGTTTGSGVALMEVYDADTVPFATRLTNISARNLVGTGSNVLVIGFVVSGSGAKTLLIRGVGPGLAQFGVGGVLTDPQLTLFNASNVAINQNDDWGSNGNLSTAATQVGAFALPAASKDAALLVSLQPGTYTVQISGANATTGIALVEVYELP